MKQYSDEDYHCFSAHPAFASPHFKARLHIHRTSVKPWHNHVSLNPFTPRH